MLKLYEKLSDHTESNLSEMITLKQSALKQTINFSGNYNRIACEVVVNMKCEY